MDYAFLIPIILIIAILVICEKMICNKVCKSSFKISELLALNEQTKFHAITDHFRISKRYDNKTNYNRIEPAYLMTADVKSNIAFYSDYISKIHENRSANVQYQTATQTIWGKAQSLDYNAIKIPEGIYKWHEKRLFQKKQLSPVIGCKFEVTMSYSSPKGRVNLSKNAILNFEDLFTCFESVSRSYLDKRTHSQLVAVERGDVSDSLRYDILNRDNFTCVICGASSRQGARLHVDHIIPVSKGGKSVPSNLRTLCERCNIGKSNKIETAEEKDVSLSQTDALICEKCGAKLVLRTATKGAKSGTQFYGCSNYPRCNYIRNIQKEDRTE